MLRAANKLLALTCLVGIHIAVKLSRSCSSNNEKITDIRSEYCDKDLVEYLQDVGVIAARRQITYSRTEGVGRRPLGSVTLQFSAEKLLLTRIFLGFTSHPVREY